MALKIQSSFAGGELDPALRERTTLQKYDSGLSTARNVIIGKTGRVVSRPGRKHVWKCKLDDKKAIIYIPPNQGLVLEFGHLYVRIYTADPQPDGYPNPNVFGADLATVYTEDDLANMHFESSAGRVYIFCKGKAMNVLNTDLGGPAFLNTAQMYGLPPQPVISGVTPSGTPAGYQVDYAVTYVYKGEESPFNTFINTGSKLPIATNQQNLVTASLAPIAMAPQITEMKVYRRPNNGGAFGYIGSTSTFFSFGGSWNAVFADIGQAADYSNAPPTITTAVSARGLTGPEAFLPRTGVIYEQRLLLANSLNEEAIEASRPGYTNNFTRDYPLSESSALTFKSGSGGYAKVLRMIDSDGLVVFTSAGIYVHGGSITPTNLGLLKKGNWIIDPQVPPLAIPGGVFFIDGSTNTIRVLGYSQEAAAYTGTEVSIYSDHLFLTKKVVSWSFQEGETPLLWVVFNDGTYASFTYERDQEMRAWTRHDSSNDVKVEYVASNGQGGKTYFVVEKNGERYVEVTVSRYVSKNLLATDSEADMSNSIAYLDSMISWSNRLNATLTLTPVVPGDWDGALVLTSSSPILVTPGVGAVGTKLRHFSPLDGTSTTMTVTVHTNNSTVTVQPDSEFPLAYAVGARLYQCKTVFTGLDHMEGESVSVIADGYVIASPNNDIENYEEQIVTGGSITLDDAYAIVHIGRPITGDTETLEIATAEQKPTLLENVTANKAYTKVYRTRGLYVGNSFAKNNKVADMQSLEEAPDDDQQPIEDIIGNRYDRPKTRRAESTLSGSYETQGKICLRQVDPVHFEILSIIPDVQTEARGS